MTYLAVFAFGVWCGLNDDKVIKWLARKWVAFLDYMKRKGMLPDG